MMRALRLALLLLVLPICLQAQAGAPAPAAPSVTLPAELDRVLRDYERHWQARDPTALAGLFTEDGMALSNGRPPARGRPAIMEAYKGGGGELRLRALAFATADTVGYIIGGYRWGAANEDMGKFVLALRRRAGEPWLIAADIDNSNRRP